MVVNPLTVSKKASIYEGISPLITKGSAPTADISTHTSATIASPSFAYITLFFVRPARVRQSHSAPAISAVIT